MKRFAEILKNHEKHWKVLQKSRFRDSTIHEQIISEGKLRSNLRLSWLVRSQVGAKRRNLTLLGGLRGTKLELKRALGAPKEAPWGPKNRIIGIDGTPRGVILGPGAPPKVT